MTDQPQTTAKALKLSDIRAGDRIRAFGWTIRCLHPSDRKTVQAAADGSLFVECGHGRHYLDGNETDDGIMKGIRRAG